VLLLCRGGAAKVRYGGLGTAVSCGKFPAKLFVYPQSTCGYPLVYHSATANRGVCFIRYLALVIHFPTQLLSEWQHVCRLFCPAIHYIVATCNVIIAKLLQVEQSITVLQILQFTADTRDHG